MLLANYIFFYLRFFQEMSGMPPPVGFPPVGGGLYTSGPVTRRAARGRPTAASGAAASAAAGAAVAPAPAPAPVNNFFET